MKQYTEKDGNIYLIKIGYLVDHMKYEYRWPTIVIDGKKVEGNLITENVSEIITRSTLKGEIMVRNSINVIKTAVASGATWGSCIRLPDHGDIRFCLTPDGLQKWRPSLAKKWKGYRKPIPTVWINAVGTKR